MTTTRTLLAGSLAGAAVLAATLMASETTPASAASAGSPTCSAVPDGATFISTGPGGVTIDRAGGSETLTLPITSALQKAARGPDGTIWVQAIGERGVEIHRIAADGTAAVVGIGEFGLQSAGWLDGRSAAVVIDGSLTPRPGDPDATGAVLVHYADGTSADVGPSGAPEFGVATVGIGAGRMTHGAWSDLTESFGYFDATGSELTDWFDPTDNATYNGPPLFQAPVAANVATAPSGATLSWVEGPDIDGATNELVGGWSLVLADAVAGTESLRLDLGIEAESLASADFDGRFWVGVFDQAGDGVSDQPRVLVVDTSAPTPTPVDAGCPPDVTVTLDRNGTPAPTEPPPPAATTTTTVAPAPTPTPTTAGPVCPAYTENTGTYPVKLCQKGYPVRSVQIYLTWHGYDIEVDGYFGPATEQAVREFQATMSIEVDGLVGPLTWGRMIGDNFDGLDTDGNGKVDPWEVQFEDASESNQPGLYVGLVYTDASDFQIVDQSTGAAIPGLVAPETWILGDGDAPLWAAKQIVSDGGMNMLWLSRSDARDGDGNALPWTVIDAVEIDIAGGSFTSYCTLDGTDNQFVAGVVGAPHSGGGPFTNITAAWSFDLSTAAIVAIVEIDPRRVTCSFEGY